MEQTERSTRWLCSKLMHITALANALGLVASMEIRLLLLFAPFLLVGCSTPFKQLHSARDLFASGQLEATRVALEKVRDDHNRYSDPAELDLAIVDLASGNPEDAERRLRRMRDKFDRQPRLQGANEVAAMVTDDTALSFRPSGYEQVLIRSMLAVCSLAHDQLDAESYTLQAMAKQSELARLSKDRGLIQSNEIYQPIAFAPYLRGVLREATHRNYDDAAQSYRLVSEVEPQFSAIGADIQRASVGAHSEPDHGVIYVIACTGRGPVLEETEAPVTTAAMQIASVMLQQIEAEKNQDGEKETLSLPNLASVKVPTVTSPQCHIARVGVEVDGRPVGVTETITDIKQLAISQLEAEMPWTIARAVVRRVSKELAVAKAGKSLGLDGIEGSLFRFATSTLWSGMEHADTRCWSLLPREIQVLRFELPAGKHSLRLSTLGWSEEIYRSSPPMEVEVVNGENNYVIAIAPDERIYTVH